MGADKALVEVDGIPMALRVALAMRAAGAREVIAVGGDSHALTALGLHWVPDAYPGDGPLGGIITALRACGEGIAVVTACDMPWIAAKHVAPLVDALAASPDAHVALTDQYLHAAWRAAALPSLEAAWADGERAPRRVLARLKVVDVDLPAGRWADDVDSPADL